MKIYYAVEKVIEASRFNAGSKARDDVNDILLDSGAIPVNISYDAEENREGKTILDKLVYHRRTASIWDQGLKDVESGSAIVFQFPVRAHTLFFYKVLRRLKKRRVKTIAIIHDLECLRNSLLYQKGQGLKGKRYKYEEVFCLQEFDKIIAHNEHMKDIISSMFNINRDKMVSLEIFDYLIPDYVAYEKSNDRVVIAGNLDRNKSGYVYKLPDDVKFNVYGANYSGEKKTNIDYKGAFLPDELPLHMNGMYGLVWDGPETTTCSGVHGSYMKYNNPHKTSLYLACGIPVIVWDKAAIADFVLGHRCGIAVNSIDDLRSVLEKMSEESYMEMRSNAAAISKRLRTGEFTKKAIERCNITRC